MKVYLGITKKRIQDLEKNEVRWKRGNFDGMSLSRRVFSQGPDEKRTDYLTEAGHLRLGGNADETPMSRRGLSPPERRRADHPTEVSHLRRGGNSDGMSLSRRDLSPDGKRTDYPTEVANLRRATPTRHPCLV